MVMQAVIEKKSSLATLANEMQTYPQCLKNIIVKDKKAAQEDPAVLAAAEKVKEELAGEGRILLRASGTEPKVRVMVEAKTDELAEKCVDDVIAVIKAEGLALE